MGELILFRPRPGRILQKDAPQSREAQIMFFTGVRYERMIDPPAPADDVHDPRPANGLGRPGRSRKRRRG